MPSAESTTSVAPLAGGDQRGADLLARRVATPFHSAGGTPMAAADQRLRARVRAPDLQLIGIGPGRHRIRASAETEDVVRRRQADALLASRPAGRRSS